MIGNQQKIKTVQTDMYKKYISCIVFLLLFCYFNELTVVKSMVETSFGDQFIVTTLFNNTSILHNQDFVSITDGGETMGYNKAGASFHKTLKSFLYHKLCTGIDTGCSFVKDQHRRQTEHNSGDAEKLFFALA